MFILTTGVSQTGLSRAGQCGPCVQWASSTAYPQRWPSATPYTPALLSIASVHPRKTGCSPLCDPSLGLERGREGAEWVPAAKLIGFHLVGLSVPGDHYFRFLFFKSNLCLLVFISFLKNVPKKQIKKINNTKTWVKLLGIPFEVQTFCCCVHWKRASLTLNYNDRPHDTESNFWVCGHPIFSFREIGRKLKWWVLCVLNCTVTLP